MCRLLKSHPVKTIFVILISVSSLHVIYKILITESKSYLWENINISCNVQNTPNTSKIFSDSQVISKNVALCEVEVKKLRSSISVNQEPVSMKTIEQEEWSSSIQEGHWSPSNCTPKDKVAIIIPFRNREQHLNIFLRHIHPFLQSQLISYRIFIIEQAEGTRFNRASLFNVGYVEALKENNVPYNCFIFHDVDLLPTNENNFYKCGQNPIHLSVAIDKFNYRLPYNGIFGGAVALSKEQFQTVNGFSNIFYGWGGEDDDMSYRLSAVKYSISRYPNSVSRYVMIRHSSDSGNPANDARWKLLKDSGTRFKIDGLSTLEYTIIQNNITKSNLIKWITVQFPEQKILKQWKI